MVLKRICLKKIVISVCFLLGISNADSSITYEEFIYVNGIETPIAEGGASASNGGSAASTKVSGANRNDLVSKSAQGESDQGSSVRFGLDAAFNYSTWSGFDSDGMDLSSPGGFGFDVGFNVELPVSARASFVFGGNLAYLKGHGSFSYDYYDYYGRSYYELEGAVNIIELNLEVPLFLRIKPIPQLFLDIGFMTGAILYTSVDVDAGIYSYSDSISWNTIKVAVLGGLGFSITDNFGLFARASLDFADFGREALTNQYLFGIEYWFGK